MAGTNYFVEVNVFQSILYKSRETVRPACYTWYKLRDTTGEVRATTQYNREQHRNAYSSLVASSDALVYVGIV